MKIDLNLIEARTYDWSSQEMRNGIVELFAGYLAECMDQGTQGAGYPVHPSPQYKTGVLYYDGEMVCFASVDHCVADGGAPAVELIYVKPQFRQHGIGSAMIKVGQKVVPDLRLKGPLSPTGQALADQTGAGVSGTAPSEIDAYEKYVTETMASANAYCRERKGHRPGNPKLPCQRCRCSLASKVAAAFVDAATQDRRAFEKWRTA